MSTPDEDLPDDYASWLAACDDALAVGKTPAAESGELSSGSAPAAEPGDLVRDLKYLSRVRRLLRPDASQNRSAEATTDPYAGPHSQLGDFRIVRQIARGGMGVVYEAEQLSIGRRVALKVLPFAAVLDSKQLQRFKNEVHTVGQLHHTHIVPIYSVGCDRGVHYYAMQYIDGQTLAQMISELRQVVGRPAVGVSRPSPRSLGGLPPPRSPGGMPPDTDRDQHATVLTQHETNSTAFCRTVANLGVQAAAALDYAHELGVIHRDIKPGNLLVDARGNIWITDFGLARIFSPSLRDGEGKRVGPDLTLTGDLVGTLRYMSPEQALAKHVLVDHRTDIYSLGVTLYELLTLEPALGGGDQEEVLRQIAFEEPRPPRRLNKAIPPELETIVLKAIAKNPSERYATALELADDLRRFLEDKPIWAKRPTLRQRMTKWARRHRAVVWSGAAFLALAFVGLLTSTLVIARQRDIARANYNLAEDRKELAETHARAAEEQRQLAQRNFQRARAAVDDMLTNVASERLADVPQMERVRRTLLEDALGFYQQFLEEKNADPEVRLETARAYRAVANLRLYLGEIAESEEPADRSVELLETLAVEFPAQPQYRNELARSLGTSASMHISAGRLLKAEQEVREAMAIYEELSAKFPDEADYRLDVAGCHNSLGGLLRDRPRDAEVHFRTAIRICEAIVNDSSETPKSSAVVAGSYYLLGTLLMESTQSREAEQALRRAITELDKANPGSSTANQRSIIAATRLCLAMTLEAEGRVQESEESYRDAMGLYAQLALDFPFVPAFRGAWQSSLWRLAPLLLKAGHEDEVQAIIRQFEDAAAKLPSEAMSHTTMRDFFDGIAAQGAAIGAYESAERALDRVIELDTELAAELPDEPAYRMRLAEDHANLADCRSKQGRREEAVDGHRQAIAMYEKLVTDYPQDLLFRYRLAAIQNFLGILFRPRIDEAEKLHGQAIGICEKLVADAPDEPNYRGELARGHYALGLARTAAGQAREAAESYRQAIAVGESWGDRLGNTNNTYVIPAAHCALFENLISRRPASGGPASGGRPPSEARPAYADRSPEREEADVLYGKLIKLNPSDAEGKNHLAWLLATCSETRYRNPPKAVELARQAVALTPRDANIWNTLGVAQFRAGNWNGAIEALMQSEDLARGKQTADNAFFLAMAHFQLAGSQDTTADQQSQHKTAARQWYDEAVAWMEKHSPRNQELKQFQAEVEELFGMYSR